MTYVLTIIANNEHGEIASITAVSPEADISGLTLGRSYVYADLGEAIAKMAKINASYPQIDPDW